MVNITKIHQQLKYGVLSRKKITILFAILIAAALTSTKAQDVWSQKSDFGGAGRYGAVGFSIGAKGYIGCGWDGGSYLRDFWEYDPATNAWAQKANLEGAGREMAVGFSIGTKGYVGTGNNANGGLRKDFWEYDPANNTWKQKANFGGTARWVAAGFSIGNKGYIGTGSDNITHFKKDFWEYDPATDKWTRKADFAGAGTFHAVGFSIGGKGYLGTGNSVNDNNNTNDFWQYNPSTDSWTKKASFGGTPRGSAVGFSIGNKGYIGTGIDNSNNVPKNDFWEYDPTTNIWTQKANFEGSARDIAAGFSVDNKGYIGTGRRADNPFSNDFWVVGLTLPVLYISSPVDDATYPAPGQILLSAEAFNPGGKIKSVSFYNGSTLIFNETTAPYSRTWHNVPLGDYTITAVAIDDKGVKNTSAPVQVHVVPDKPPVVSLSSPADDASFAVPGDIVLTADASDPDGKIRSVSFYNGSTLIFNETTAPYSRTWHKLPLGDYTITAVATDNGGNKTTSAPVKVHVVPDKPPIVALTSPSDGASFAVPGTILLTADASDDRKIRSVSFYNGSTLIFNETTAPYSRTWHKVPAGDYTITAVALDDAGYTTTSSPIHVQVGSLTTLTTAKTPSTAEKDFTTNATLTVAPNPANNILNVHTTGLEKARQVSVSVVSPVGVIVQTKQITSSVTTFQLDVSHLAKGVYTIRLMSDKKVLYKQFIKL